MATTNEEKEEGDDDESSSEEEETTGGGGGFMMMLDDDDEESESESDESSHDDGDDGDSKNEKMEKTMNNITKNATPRKKKAADKKEEEEEDLDAILSDMNIIQQQDTADTHTAIDSAASANIEQNVLPTTIRQLLLSTNNKNGYDVQDLDLDNAMRSLLGGENDPFLTSQISLLLLRWQSQQRQAIT